MPTGFQQASLHTNSQAGEKVSAKLTRTSPKAKGLPAGMTKAHVALKGNQNDYPKVVVIHHYTADLSSLLRERDRERERERERENVNC